jgi:hypothetical protein
MRSIEQHSAGKYYFEMTIIVGATVRMSIRAFSKKRDNID